LKARDTLVGIAMLMICGLALGAGLYIGFRMVGLPNFGLPTMTYVTGYVDHVQQSSCQNGFIIMQCFYADVHYNNITNHAIKYGDIGNVDDGDVVCVSISNGYYNDFTVGDCK
jgi:hypothetical protein